MSYIPMPPRNTTAETLAQAISKYLKMECSKHFPLTQIGEVAEITSGGTPDTNNSAFWDGDIVWITPKDLGRPRTIEITTSERRITTIGVSSSSAKLLPIGTVLLSSRAPIGHLGISHIPLATNQGFKNIICKDRLYNRFLFHILRGSISDLQSFGRGNTFSEIPSRIVKEYAIPLPSIELQKIISSFLDTVYHRLSKNYISLPPLPKPLAEQKRIVAKIERLAEKIEEARKLSHQSCVEADILIRLYLHKLTSGFSSIGQLKEFLINRPRNGWSANCDNADDGIAVLTLSAITGFHYNSSAYKKTSLTVNKNAHYWLNNGDLLITRSNTPELVGHAAIYNGFPSPCIYPDLIMKLVIDEEKADTQFVWYWLQSQTVRKYIMGNAKGTSPTMKKIAQDTVMNIPFPVGIPIEKQRQIAHRLNALQKKIENLKSTQTQTAAELDALLPSILDKAFKGKL